MTCRAPRIVILDTTSG